MITHWEGGIIMSTRLKKLLALSLSISVAATGLFNDIGAKNADAAVVEKQNKNSRYINFGGKGTLKIGSKAKGVAENNAYFFNNHISSVKVSKKNKYLKAQDGVLYSKDMKILYYYPAMKQNKKFTIPSTVTMVVRYAFANNNFLEQLNMGKNVKYVGTKAFSECSRLKNITWKCMAQTIPAGCFEKCHSLKNIKLGDNVKNIKTGAFKQCSSLNRIYIPRGVSEIEDYAFSGAGKEFFVVGNNIDYSSNKGVLFTKDMSGLVAYPGTKQGGYILPDTVDDICAGAFSNSVGLTEITFGKNIYAVDMGWFDKCANLKRINMPPELQSVDSYVEYSGLESLEKVTLSESNKYFSIYDDTLYSKDYKTLYVMPFGKSSLELAPQVESIVYLDMINDRYKNVLTKNSFSEINISSQNQYFVTVDGVLYDKDITKIMLLPGKITSYKMPATVNDITGILNGFFGETEDNIANNSLSDISVEKENLLYVSKDGVLFSKDMNKLYVYPQEKKGNYTLPDETTLMDMFAFTEARGLTGLTISENCDRIYMDISGCAALKKITVKDGVDTFRIKAAETLNISSLKLGKDVSYICLQGNLNKAHNTVISSAAKGKDAVEVLTGIQAAAGEGDEEIEFLTFKDMSRYVEFMGYRFK